MDRFSQTSELDEATKAETAEALNKSRQFLTTRLLPDLDRANRDHQGLVAQIDEYKKLREALRSLDTEEGRLNDGTAAKSRGAKGATMLADVGGGVAIQTQL